MDDLFVKLNAVLSPLPSSVHARHFSAQYLRTSPPGIIKSQKIIKPQKYFQCKHLHHNLCRKVTFIIYWATVKSSDVGRVGTLVGQELKPIHIANKRENIFIAITKHYLIQSIYTANQLISR